MDSDGLMTEYDELSEGVETKFYLVSYKSASDFWILPESKRMYLDAIETNMRAWADNSDSVFSSDEILSIKIGNIR
jgi:hypothetical protein